LSNSGSCAPRVYGRGAAPAGLAGLAFGGAIAGVASGWWAGRVMVADSVADKG